jgi:hypothetical protein
MVHAAQRNLAEARLNGPHWRLLATRGHAPPFDQADNLGLRSPNRAGDRNLTAELNVVGKRRL